MVKIKEVKQIMRILEVKCEDEDGKEFEVVVDENVNENGVSWDMVYGSDYSCVPVEVEEAVVEAIKKLQKRSQEETDKEAEEDRTNWWNRFYMEVE